MVPKRRDAFQHISAINSEDPLTTDFTAALIGGWSGRHGGHALGHVHSTFFLPHPHPLFTVQVFLLQTFFSFKVA